MMMTLSHQEAIIYLPDNYDLGISFALKYLGLFNVFIGIEDHHFNNGLFLSQSKYILNILKMSKMEVPSRGSLIMASE